MIEHGKPDRAPKRVWRRARVIAAASAALLGGVAFGIAWLSGGSHQPTAVVPTRVASPSPSASLASGNTLGVRLLGETPLVIAHATNMVIAGDAVWLSSWETGLLTRVAGPRPHVTARLHVGGPSESALSIAYGTGSLWVVDAAHNSLLDLDPADGHQRKALGLAPWGVGDSVAFGGGFAWVACSDQLGNSGPRERLLKVDPSSLRVVHVTPLPGEGEDLLVTASGDDIWVGGATRLSRIEPKTGQLASGHVSGVKPTALNGHVPWTELNPQLALSLNGRVLWLYLNEALASVNASDGRVLARTPVASDVLAVDSSGRAWTTEPTVGVAMIRPTGSIYRFPEYNGLVDAIAAEARTLWIYTGRRVLSFDISQLSVG